MGLLIKTINVLGNAEDFDKEVNKFCNENTVRATQTHVSYDSLNVCLIYTAILFYEVRK